MSYTVTLNEEEARLVESYCKFHGIAVQDAFRNSLLETIEDEYDAAVADIAYAEYLKDPETVTHEEFMKQLSDDFECGSAKGF